MNTNPVAEHSFNPQNLSFSTPKKQRKERGEPNGQKKQSKAKKTKSAHGKGRSEHNNHHK